MSSVPATNAAGLAASGRLSVRNQFAPAALTREAAVFPFCAMKAMKLAAFVRPAVVASVLQRLSAVPAVPAGETPPLASHCPLLMKARRTGPPGAGIVSA